MSLFVFYSVDNLYQSAFEWILLVEIENCTGTANNISEGKAQCLVEAREFSMMREVARPEIDHLITRMCFTFIRTASSSYLIVHASLVCVHEISCDF